VRSFAAAAVAGALLAGAPANETVETALAPSVDVPISRDPNE